MLLLSRNHKDFVKKIQKLKFHIIGLNNNATKKANVYQ